MNFAERKELRLKLLQDAYDFHFNNNGNIGRVNHRSLDAETKLAYEYLFEANYLKKEAVGLETWGVKITTNGIDYIESKPPKSNQSESATDEDDEDDKPNDDRGFFS